MNEEGYTVEVLPNGERWLHVFGAGGGQKRSKANYRLVIKDPRGTIVHDDPHCADNEAFCRAKARKLIRAIAAKQRKAVKHQE